MMARLRYRRDFWASALSKLVALASRIEQSLVRYFESLV